MGKILGLDVGIGSLGWAVIDEDQRRIVDLGVRIFESGEENASKAADRASQIRRSYRASKRLNKRRRQRKIALKKILERENIISAEVINASYRKKGFSPDVWRFRAEGLDRKLDAIELASILINFANYRGYQDFYEDSDEEDAGKLAEAKNRINKIFNDNKAKYRTIGEMIYKEEEFKNPVNGKLIIRNRAKRENGKPVTDYKYLIDRRYLMEELRKLLLCQRDFGYDQFTDDLIAELCATIFHQRDFEDGPGPNKKTNNDKREAMLATLKGHQTYSGFDDLVGYCPFYPSERRTHKNSQLYDMYVLINSLSQLEFFDSDNNEINLPENLVYECRQRLFEKDGVLTKKDIEALCKEYGIGVKIPSELAKKKQLLKAPYIKLLVDTDIFTDELIKRFKEEDYDDKNSLSSKIGLAIAQFATPRRRKDEIKKLMTEEDYQAIGYADKLKTVKSAGGANVSDKYMKEAIQAYFDGLKYGKFQAKFNDEHPEDSKRDYLGKNGKLLPIQDTDMVRNPVVYRSLNETRKIVNAVFGKYKDITAINVEVAKDVGKSFEQRKETMKFQKENEDKNNTYREELSKKLYAENMPQMLSDKLMERFKLWKDQKEMCIYSGEKISFAKLVGGTEVQVDHIIPQSKVLDETLNNKVLVLTAENQKKGNDVPLKYMSKDQADEFINRVNNLFRTENISRIKKEYLLLPCIDDETISGFVDRNINDTRTISKYISSYLSKAYAGSVKVHVIKGAVTSRFRKRWLGQRYRCYGNVPSIYGLEEKTRNLHYYHHAIDAVVVANLTRPYIELAQDYEKLESIRKDYDFHAKRENSATAKKLYDNYCEEKAKSADKMAKVYGFNREYTLSCLDQGFVPSLCEDIRNEIETRVPLDIEFDAKDYVEMERAYRDLRIMLNNVRLNLITTEHENISDLIDPDTLEEINVRLPLVCPEIACIKSNGQIVYENKEPDADADWNSIKKELDSFTKKLQPRSVMDYVKDIRMLSEEEYAEKVHDYYDDKCFADSIEVPYVSFKIDRKFRGGMVASDNPIPLAKTGFSSYKQLEDDINNNLKSPYYIRFNKGIGENANFSIYDARSYYCMEIYLDENNAYQIRGIRYVDIRKDYKSGKLILMKPLPVNCTHCMYLFKNEYIKVYKRGRLINNGFGAYRGVENIKQNTGKIRLYSNTNLKGRDTVINLAAEIKNIELTILGHVLGERKCGDQSLFITESGLM